MKLKVLVFEGGRARVFSSAALILRPTDYYARLVLTERVPACAQQEQRTLDFRLSAFDFRFAVKVYTIIPFPPTPLHI